MTAIDDEHAHNTSLAPDTREGAGGDGAATAVDTASAEAGASPKPGRWGRWRRSVPRVVWLVFGLHVVVLGAYSILLPTYRAPDEPLHVDLAHLFSEDFRYPAWDDRDTGAEVIASLDDVDFAGRAAHLHPDDAPPKGDRPSFEELGEREGADVNRGINQLPQHPPLYYAVAGTLERGAEVVVGDPNFQLETWFYRLVSIAMVAPLPIVIWRVSKRLGLPDPVGVAAMLVPLAIPQYLHIGASVNNDNLQFLFIWLAAPLVLRLADGDLRTRTVVAAGVVSGLGLFTKAFAFVTPAWVGLALALALVRAGWAAWPRVARAGLIYGALTVALGGWWWIRNVVSFGEIMPTRYDDVVRDRPPGGRDAAEFTDQWITLTVRRFWGDFGYYDTRLPGLVVTVATLLCLALIVVACVARDRVAGTRRGDRILLAAALPLLMGIQYVTALDSYMDSGRFAGLQGRYWFGAIAPIAVVIALGAAILARGLRRWLPAMALAAVCAMQGFALATILGFYWGDPGSPLTSRLRAVTAWAPLPGEVIAAAALVGVVVGAAALVEIGRVVLRDDGEPGHQPAAG